MATMCIGVAESSWDYMEVMSKWDRRKVRIQWIEGNNEYIVCIKICGNHSQQDKN